MNQVEKEHVTTACQERDRIRENLENLVCLLFSSLVSPLTPRLCVDSGTTCGGGAIFE